MSDSTGEEPGELIDPGEVISAETLDDVAARLDGCDPFDVVEAVVDGDERWWDGIDLATIATLDRLAADLVDHPEVGVVLARAGYRMGRQLLGDGPQPADPPDLAAHGEALLDIDGSVLLDHLPKEASPLSLWLSEELVRRNGWWDGPDSDHGLDADDMPAGLIEIRTSGLLAADLGWCAAMLEHDLIEGRSAR